MNAIQFSPMITIQRDGMIAVSMSRVVFVNDSFGGHFGEKYGAPVSEVYSMADVFGEYGVTEMSGLMDEVVLSVNPVQNTFCGGKAVVWVSILNKSKARAVGSVASGFYISEDDKGIRTVAFPA